jgi:hypothetical protein
MAKQLARHAEVEVAMSALDSAPMVSGTPVRARRFWPDGEYLISPSLIITFVALRSPFRGASDLKKWQKSHRNAADDGNFHCRDNILTLQMPSVH